MGLCDHLPKVLFPYACGLVFSQDPSPHPIKLFSPRSSYLTRTKIKCNFCIRIGVREEGQRGEGKRCVGLWFSKILKTVETYRGPGLPDLVQQSVRTYKLQAKFLQSHPIKAKYRSVFLPLPGKMSLSIHTHE